MINRLKKIHYILLLSVLLVLTACGSSTSKSSSDEKPKNSTSTQNETIKETRAERIDSMAKSGYELYRSTNKNENLNIRNGPGKNYDVVGAIKPGTEVRIIGESENGYLPINYKGSLAFIAAAYMERIEEGSTESSGVSKEATAGNIYITSTNLNIRTQPGNNGTVIETLSKGEEVIVVGELENGYYPISYNGKTGYAYAKYLNPVNAADSVN